MMIPASYGTVLRAFVIIPLKSLAREKSCCLSSNKKVRLESSFIILRHLKRRAFLPLVLLGGSWLKSLLSISGCKSGVELSLPISSAGG